MPAERLNRGPLIGLWQWVKDQIVQEVPKDIALCEFDCRQTQCAMGEWETCAHRLEKAALEQKTSAADSPPGGTPKK